jgi:hypothetical protein
MRVEPPPKEQRSGGVSRWQYDHTAKGRIRKGWTPSRATRQWADAVELEQIRLVAGGCTKDEESLSQPDIHSDWATAWEQAGKRRARTRAARYRGTARRGRHFVGTPSGGSRPVDMSARTSDCTVSESSSAREIRTRWVASGSIGRFVASPGHRAPWRRSDSCKRRWRRSRGPSDTCGTARSTASSKCWPSTANGQRRRLPSGVLGQHALASLAGERGCAAPQGIGWFFRMSHATRAMSNDP